MCNKQNIVTEICEKAQADKVRKETLKAQLEAMKVCVQFFKAYKGYTVDLIKTNYNSLDSIKTTPEERSDQAFAELLHEESLLSNTAPKQTRLKQKQPAKKTRRQSKIQKEKSIELPEPTEPTNLMASAISPTLLAVTADKPTSITTLAQQVMELNKPDVSIYHLHDRVKRWCLELSTDEDFETIRLFADYRKRVISYPYAGLDKCLLKYQRDAHNVGWARRIISSPLGKKYSFDHHYSESQSGKALVASLVSEGETKTGLIVLGIGNDRVIYHGKLRLFAKKDIMSTRVTPFAKLLKIDPLTSPLNEEEDKSCSEPWQETVPVRFSLIDNDIIEIKVTHSKITQAQKQVLAKSEPATIYHVYPLV